MAKTAMTKLAGLTPVEVDTVLAANWDEQARLMSYIQGAQSAADRYSKGGLTQLAAREQAEVAKHVAALKAACVAAQPYEAEYTRRRWHRYFLVTNGYGHVHRERSCTTCFPTTRYAWLVTLSGCDERAMVAEYGTDACTVCFPNAPVLARQLGAVSKTQREREAARTARQAKRAAAEAKRQANSITNPDGTVLMDASWTIYTVSEARRRLVDAAGTICRDIPNKEWQEKNRVAFERIARALAAKTGEDIEVLKNAALAKAMKRGY
jgi:hypothetical protein